MTQQQKILILMSREPSRWFYPYDFMERGLGDLFVGYKAPTRLSELEKKYSPIFERKKDGDYILRRLNVDEIKLWLPKLPYSLAKFITSTPTNVVESWDESSKIHETVNTTLFDMPVTKKYKAPRRELA